MHNIAPAHSLSTPKRGQQTERYKEPVALLQKGLFEPMLIRRTAVPLLTELANSTDLPEEAAEQDHD